jgi:NADPH2:quinone reductase
MPFAEAAAFQFTYETAFYALITRARLQPGETVLVLGAAGGVGAASVQIAKAFGARVIAAASSADKLAFAIAQGAEDGIVYGRGPDSGLSGRELTEALKSVVGAKGADVIVDPVGGFYAEPAIRAAAVGSRYLVLGFTAGIAALPMNLPLLKSCDVLGINWRTFTLSDAVQSDANRQSILQLYADGKIAPPVMTTFPLAQGGEAIAALQRRDVLGKVVVTL